jgi:hypothetical protein
MYKKALLVLFTGFATPSFAQSCPEFYRFVDFGLKESDGTVTRGGTIFRAFNAEGTPLLKPEVSICRPVENLAKDGRALFIPVVSKIGIDPIAAKLDVTQLTLTEVSDVVSAAEDNAKRHGETLAKVDTATTRGEDYICASTPATDELSCQMLSLYGGNAPLVAYCDEAQCNVPVWARDKQLAISVKWPRGAAGPASTGQEIRRKLQSIYDFLKVQM